jgi:DNA-binding GntR family transcriptional regulator
VLAPLSLKQQVYETIKRAILTLRFEPGDALVESDLAEQLGVSKTPVRDALFELEKEGLVIRILHKGTYVSRITKKDMCDIFELRAVLEGLAVRVATPLMADDLEKAEAFLNTQEEALKQGDVQAASLANRQFHTTIIQKAGKHRLLSILGNLEDHTQRFRVISDHLDGRLSKSLVEHRRVLQAMKQGDALGAEEGMRAHLHSVLADLAEANIPDLDEE